MLHRLIRCLLGDDAVANKKVQHGNPLPVLGILVSTNAAGITFVPEPEKLQKYKQQIQEALRTKTLPGARLPNSQVLLASRSYNVHQ